MQTEHYCERCGVQMDTGNPLPICSKCAWAEDATEPLTPIDDGYSEDEWYEDDDYIDWECYSYAPSRLEILDATIRLWLINMKARIRNWWHRNDPDWIPF